MNDLIKEPYELSIWETSLEQNSYNNLIPPLNKAYQDEWEVFSETKTNPLDILKLKDVGESKTENSKDWSEFYFRNSSGVESDTYIYTTNSFPASLEKNFYTLFIEIKDFKYLNTLNNEVPTCEVKIVDNQSFLFSGAITNGILRLIINEKLANKKIEVKVILPRGTKKGIRNVPSELAFQIRLSLFEGELSKVPNPFPYYDGTNASWIKKENKLYIIGSNSMVAPNRAINPVVKTKVNGDKTLTFSLYSKYFDSERGDFVENPFIKILHNESYLKLRRGDEDEKDVKWEEYIVKNITENSANKIYTYTAKRAAAIELGKTGYNLEFSTELMNNQGTAVELTKQVFANSDWVIDEEHCDKFWGAAVEPVYEATINSIFPNKIECIRQAKLDSYDLYYNEVNSNNPTRRELVSNNKVYIPYSSYQNRQKNGYIQFLYPENEEVEIDESGRIYNASSYIYKNFSDNYLKDVIISNGYKGDHLQKRIKTRYIKNLNKIVQEGTINGDLIHKITDTNYQTNNSVPELIVNGKDFESTIGWREGSGDVHITLNTETDTLENIWGENYSVKLVLSNSKTEELGYFYNAAIRSNASIIDSFTEGDQYCVQIKSDDLSYLNGFSIAVYYYNANNKLQILRDIVSFSHESTKDSIATYSGTCDFSISNKEIVNGLTIDGTEGKVGLIFKIKPLSAVAFNSISLFKKVFKTDDSYYIPGNQIEAKAITEEKYYDPNLEDNINAKSLSELIFCEGSGFQPNYYEDYVKVSSIEISKSNRFNILQEICEAFECWADLQVEHNTDGTISNKKIVLKNFVGENKQIGFSYGLNLKDINRTLISDQIVTKLIVEPNNNENGLNGFSTIARAKDNQSKDNVLYNFDYYINQGVLDREVLTQDIYGKKGLLYRLGKINSKIIELNGELIAKQMQATQLQSEVTTAKEVISATQEEIIQLEQDFYDRTGKAVSEIEKLTVYEDNSVLKGILTNILLQTKKLNQVIEQSLVPQISFLLLTEKEIPQLEGKIEEYKKDQQSYLAIFTDKYANYIQEGTWTDESYYDDDLYYLDAQNVLYTSAFPKISYTINVIDVSPLGEEYSPFKFNIGDKTYIEDVEFFGWNAANNFPYREEVVISEIEEHLDSPEQNKITVQNYKTQFEDLFQRIAATTQSLQYAAGGYQRAANKIASTNSIDPETVQNSFLQGIIDLQNMGNMSVKWTSEGMVISNQRDPNNRLRLSNVGITQSSDGGETWKTVLLGGRGITANSIVTGTLDANKISIKSGDYAAFIWDSRGLRAYDTTWNVDGTLASVSQNTYIEFNDNGLIAYKLEEDGSLIHPFKLTSDGQLELTGKITAKEGYIGDWEISSGGLIKGTDEAWLVPNGTKTITIDGVQVPIVFKAGDNFKVSTTGKLYATEADISGKITANEGQIGGWYIGSNILKNSINTQTIWLSPQGAQSVVNGAQANYVFYANGNFGVDTSGKLHAVYADISGHIEAGTGKIGDWFLQDRILTNQGQRKIWLAPGGHTGTIMEGTEDEYEDSFVFYANDNFGVNTDGKLYANDARIFGEINATTGKIGNWYIVDNYLSSTDEDTSSGIILDATYSTIYSKQFDASNGGDGWKITNNEAIFNNITLRGALKCAVLEYAEVQAVGGIMMIRPATTIKDVEITPEDDNAQTYTLILTVENSELFTVGDWCKLTSEANGDILKTDNEEKQILYSGINVNLFYLNEVIEETVNDQIIKKLKFTITSDDKDTLANKTLVGMGIVDLGTEGSIGLGLNSSTNSAMIPQTSFSVFSLEQNSNSDWKYLKPHIILGKIPDDAIYGSIANSYGLYADNVYLKGIIEASGGTIGGMDIDRVVDFTTKAEQQERYQVVVTSSTGENFIDSVGNEATVLTCRVYDTYNNNTEVTNNLSYQWYKNNEILMNQKGSTLSISNIDLGATTYSCEVKLEIKEEENE